MDLTQIHGLMEPLLHFEVKKIQTGKVLLGLLVLVRWPEKIKSGSISNDIVQHHDWLPTFLAMAGDTEIIDKLKQGYQAIGRTYKNHIDGFNLLPYLTGEVKQSPRNFYFYFSDDGDMLAIRYDNWKLVFMEQRSPRNLAGMG